MRLFPHIAAALIAATMSFGCQAATVTGPGWGDIPALAPPGTVRDPIEEGADPEQVFLEQVLPLLDTRCNGCHTDVSTAPVFIDPADPYASFLDSGVITRGQPNASQIITKGAHRGPAWRATESQTISDWISLEGAVDPGMGGGVDRGGDGGGEDPPPDPDPVAGDYETAPQAVLDGHNEIDLDDVGLPRAEIEFFAQRVALGLNLSNVIISAGHEGLVINHPIFITYDPVTGRQPDPNDRFNGVELVVAADGAALLADNILLMDFPLDGQLSISFASTSTF